MIIIIEVARSPTERDPEFLEAVSQAFSRFFSERPDRTQEQVAEELGIDQTTISKYIAKANSIDGEILARACTRLGITFQYKDFVISAAAFPAGQALTSVIPPAQQLSFTFDAMYQNGTSQWKVSHARLEPLELLLRIKVAG